MLSDGRVRGSALDLVDLRVARIGADGDGIAELPDGTPLYSLRITQAARALGTIAGDTLVLRHVEPDHDKAYH